MSIRNQLTAEINAPIGRVFALIEDPGRMKLWRDGLIESKRTKEVPGGVGSTFREKVKEGGRVTEYQGEVTAFEPLRALGVRVYNDRFSADALYRFRDLGGRTRVQYTCESTIKSKPAAVLIGWLVKAMIRRSASRQLARLKAVAESSS